jgi:hypothetical protein
VHLYWKFKQIVANIFLHAQFHASEKSFRVTNEMIEFSDSAAVLGQFCSCRSRPTMKRMKFIEEKRKVLLKQLLALIGPRTGTVKLRGIALRAMRSYDQNRAIWSLLMFCRKP